MHPGVRFGMVGCFAVVTGFFAGGMIAVLIAKIVGGLRKCVPEEGLPACDWHKFAIVGMLVGATLVPVIALSLLRRGRSAPPAKHSSP